MNEERKGELFIFFSSFIWGFFPIVTILSYRSVPSLISLAVSTFLASIPFFLILLFRRKFFELRNPLLWKYILYIVVFNSMFYYSFFYFGLTRTTPGNTSIIALFEVLTSFVFFHILRKEHFSLESKIGSVLMVIGAIIVLLPNFSFFNIGDLFIFLATFFAPVGNLFQQKAKKISSTETILFLRNIIATPLLFLLAYIFGQYLQVGQIKESVWFLILNGFIILGLSKIFWVEGISRISVTKSISLSSLAPLFTLIFAWIILHQIPTLWQVASLVPFFLGVILLTGNFKFTNAKSN